MDLGAVHAEGIVSSDIVGYTTDNLTGGKFNMNAVVFNNIDGSVVDLNSDVTFANPVGGLDDSDSDNIRVWNPATSTYTTFCLDGEEKIWYDFDGQVEADINANTPFWYLSRATGATSITFKKPF